MNPLFILSASAEVSPYSKSGGLGDVAAALPKHLAKLGHRIVSVTPFYGFMKNAEIPYDQPGIEFDVAIGDGTYHLKTKHLKLREGLDIYFICSEELYGRYQVYMYGHDNDALRFAVFSMAVVQLAQRLGEPPDVIHCHDWHTAIIPNILRTREQDNPFFSKTATVVTIHNLLFQMQGNWWQGPSDKVDVGLGPLPKSSAKIRWVNFAKRGIRYADAINTVSVRYAQEILTPEYGQGLDRLLRRRQKDVFGIINGIDYQVYNPQFDSHLWHPYDWNSLDRKRQNKGELQKMIGLEPRDDIPLIGLVHRLTEQKGFDLIKNILPVLMQLPLQMVIVGTGDRDYVNIFRRAARTYPGRIALLTPFTEELGSRVYAGSDMFLMPSRYEPCGMSQLISLRYGSIPIVRKTGGLSDTIEDFDPRTGKGTGFVFSRYASDDLLVAIVRALETFKYPQVWEHLAWQAMQESYSWDIPAEKYVELYRQAMVLQKQRSHERSDALG
ncbi:MAG: glycogen synthase [Candidatus Kerfeldbacteria bacterium]|nr:glycogen synthase [Candidatus Kerfeldbacteria bacterium]